GHCAFDGSGQIEASADGPGRGEEPVGLGGVEVRDRDHDRDPTGARRPVVVRNPLRTRRRTPTTQRIGGPLLHGRPAHPHDRLRMSQGGTMHAIRRPIRPLALVSALAVLLVALAGATAGAESNDFGLVYTGGSAGKADKKLAPIT